MSIIRATDLWVVLIEGRTTTIEQVYTDKGEADKYAEQNNAERFERSKAGTLEYDPGHMSVLPLDEAVDVIYGAGRDQGERDAR